MRIPAASATICTASIQDLSLDCSGNTGIKPKNVQWIKGASSHLSHNLSEQYWVDREYVQWFYFSKKRNMGLNKSV